MSERDRQVSFGDVVGVFKRHGTLFGAAFAAIVLVGVALAYRLPPVYESSGILLAEQPAVPDYVVRSTVPNYPEERVRVITQRVLTGDNLRRIAEENMLYPDLIASEGLVLREFRRNLTLSAESPELLENIMGASRETSAIAFSIGFRHGNPALARDVARDLVDLYLLENQIARREQAASTVSFLEVEAERLEQEIAEREQGIADFKRENAGSLPEISESNRELLDRVERDLDDAEREIRVLREQEQLYSTELAELSPYAPIVDEEGNTLLGPQDQLRVLQRRYLQLSAAYGEEYPDLGRLRREMEALSNATGLPAFDPEALRAELEQRVSELDAARTTYGADHPDVQRLERTVSNLRERLAGLPASPARRVSLDRPPDNPAYIQRQVMLDGTRSELAAAFERRASLRERMVELESQLSVSPEVEREFRALNRGYDQLLTQYADVDVKLREARTALNLESESKGERFVVLSEPSLPASPSSPNRIAYLMLTLVAAVGVGGLLVAVAERGDDTLRNASDVSLELEIPPLVAIPVIANAADLRRRRFRRLAGLTVAIAWGGVVALIVMTPAV